MSIRAFALAAVMCALVLGLQACGGGDGDEEATTPSRNAVVSCMEQSGTDARIYQRERPEKIGGLPAHTEITGVGFEEGNFEYAQTTVYLFEEGEEGEEGAEMIEGESPGSEVNVYAGGTAVGVVTPEGSETPSPKNMAMLTECIGSDPEE
jgi:hypothetical protein